ncbi:MAG: hypothetical protein MRJ92_12825 [Nitrospira sp.]|nr:hypothetical protein [Nitrospira sp.]
MELPKGIPLADLFVVAGADRRGVGMSFQAFDLYRPQRMGTRLSEFLDVARLLSLSVLILVALTFPATV